MARRPYSRYAILAHRYVSVAIYNGDLPRLDGSIPCADCGAPACEYDHRDYKKPMEVDPVCKACNQARGPGLHRDPIETGTKPPTIVQRFKGGDYRKRPLKIEVKTRGDLTRVRLRPDIFGESLPKYATA